MPRIDHLFDLQGSAGIIQLHIRRGSFLPSSQKWDGVQTLQRHRLSACLRLTNEHRMAPGAGQVLLTLGRLTDHPVIYQNHDILIDELGFFIDDLPHFNNSLLLPLLRLAALDMASYVPSETVALGVLPPPCVI